MYKIFITTFFDPNNIIHQVTRFFNFSFSMSISGSSQLNFSIQNKDTQITEENFRPYNLVHVYKELDTGSEKIGVFYIENTVEGRDYTEYQCPGIFDFFYHRVCQASFTSPPNNIGQLCQNLLLYTNGEGYTPVVNGANTCTTTADVEYKRRTILDCWQDLISITENQEDIWVDANLQLQTGQRGNDLTSTLYFKWNWQELYGANINEFSIETLNKDMANKVYGLSNTLPEYSYADPAPDPNLPLLESVQNFENATNATTLQRYTERYLNGHNKIIAIPKINPTNERKFLKDYNIGDTCTVRIVLPQKTIEVLHRIISINVSLDDQNTETVTIDTVDIDLSKSNRRKDIIDVMVSQEKRIYWLSIKDSV